MLGVGDLHVENFGTWRDIEGRLVWGINDFDEVWRLPYTVDLVRLAASAHLAIKSSASRHRDQGRMRCDPRWLPGRPHYRRSSVRFGRAPSLAARYDDGRPPRPEHFWAKLEALTPVPRVPASARKAIEGLLPAKGLRYSVAHRIAGLGSLGRERYVATAEFHGGKIAREAKALGAVRGGLGSTVAKRLRFTMKKLSSAPCAPLILSCI